MWRGQWSTLAVMRVVWPNQWSRFDRLYFMQTVWIFLSWGCFQLYYAMSFPLIFDFALLFGAAPQSCPMGVDLQGFDENDIGMSREWGKTWIAFYPIEAGRDRPQLQQKDRKGTWTIGFNLELEFNSFHTLWIPLDPFRPLWISLDPFRPL